MKKTIKNYVLELAKKVACRVPGIVVRLRYHHRFGRWPRLKHPIDLNEKILHEKLYGDISQWVQLADKYRVREYVEACGLKDILIPLLGAWEKVEDIPFEQLPDRFILKANNGDGKGTNIKVDKSQMNDHDWQQLKETLGTWLTTKYIGAFSAEPQYRDIKPLIVAETLLPDNKGSSSLIDYKLWCFEGEPFSFFVCADRQDNGYEANIGCYDLEWNFHPENMRSTAHMKVAKTPLPRPKCLDEMIRVGRILSKPFPQVRVDLYEANGKVYFGELTFTSLGGMMNYYTAEYLNEMGAKIKNIGK